MRELTLIEMDEIGGAGYLLDLYGDIFSIAEDIPNFYQTLIDSTTDMICIGTGNC